MDASIRLFCEDDMENVVELSLLAWAPVFDSFRKVLGPEVFPIVYPDWRTQQREVVEKACRDREKLTAYVAEVDRKAVGLLVVQLKIEEKEGEVYLLAVHPEYQNRGIGTDLNNYALDRFRDAGMKVASVATGGDPGHAPARRSYEKAGYSPFPQVWYTQAL
jgi:GNAT superfamily N-acetyltransferase